MPEFKYQPAADAHLGEVERLRSVRREPGLVSATARLVSAAAAGLYLRAFHRLSVEGIEHLPVSPPMILVANHASHLDALILASVVPARLRSCVYPIAAGDTFFSTPASAALAAWFLNALPMWRRAAGSHALADLRARLLDADRPCGFILFPEGTRTRSGAMGRFKPGVGMLVAGTGVPVVPCRIGGAFAALAPGRRVPRPRRIGVRIGPPRRYPHVADDREGWERIAADLEAAVGALG